MDINLSALPPNGSLSCITKGLARAWELYAVKRLENYFFFVINETPKKKLISSN